ncbi:EpsG family protein, partial [Vibrio lentus]
MNLYLFLSLIIVCVPFFSFIPNNKGGGSVIKYVTCCFLFFLLLFVGLRGDVDADYKNYLNMFNSVPNFQNGIDFDEYGNIHGEFLYLFFNSIFKFFNLTFSSFLLFVALLSFFLKYYVISQHVRNSNLSISLYLSFSYFLVEFVQIRWGLAISVGLLAIHFLNERRYIKSILLALAAGLIQSLAFIITPFVFIYSIVFKLITKNKII